MRKDALNRLKSSIEDIFKDRTRLLRILLIILILLLAFVLKMRENAKADIVVENSGDGGISADEICVDIGGAVVNPGVYTVERQTRLYEVIDMAGGLLSNADTDSINRAEYVEDGEKITIPVRLSAAETDDPDEPSASGDDSDSRAMPADETSSSSVSNGIVNINTATKEELMTLSGIGEAKAEKIIEYRSSNRFRKKEDIKSVNGIGDAVYSKIKDSITV